VFRAKLERGDPSPDWDALVEECGSLLEEFERVLGEVARPAAPVRDELG
jgi:hypothetical protein